MSNVDAYLKMTKLSVKTTRTSFDLSTENYEIFRKYCKKSGARLSSVVDMLIRDFNEKHGLVQKNERPE